MRRLGTVLLLVLGGCSALAAYPSAEAEESFEACHDGADGDFDDLIDCDDDSCAEACVEQCDLAEAGDRVDEDQDELFGCADPDCDGSCPEWGLEACADRRDQDGDGLVDFEDAGCWYLADVSVDSCTSVAAVDRTLDFDGTDESWAHRGDVLRPDPTGRFSGDSLVVTTPAESSRVSLGSEIASASVGLRLEASVYFDPALSAPRFGAVIGDLSEADGYFVLTAGTVRRGATQQLVLEALGADGVADLTSLRWEASEGWYVFELAIPDADHATLRVTGAAGEVVAMRSVVLTRRLEESHRFEVFVDPGLEAGDLVVVGELHWQGEPYQPCGVETPSSTDPFRAQVIDGVILPDEMCLLSTTDGLSLSLAQSADRGLTTTGAPATAFLGMRAPLAAAREGDGSLVTISQEVRGLFPSSRHFLSRSDDCTSLSDVASFELPGPRVIGMRAIDDGYELVRTNATRARAANVLLERITREGVVRDSMTVGSLSGDLRAIPLGNDVILTNLLSPGRISVLSSGPPRIVLDVAVVVPSGRAGACDESSVLPALLTLDPSPVVTGATATGLVLVPYCNPASAGLVAHRFTVRPPGEL